MINLFLNLFKCKSVYTILLEIVLDDLLDLKIPFMKSMHKTRMQQESILFPIMVGQKKNKSNNYHFSEPKKTILKTEQNEPKKIRTIDMSNSCLNL